MLSSDDPVRVFEEFSQVDLLSGGRAEIMAGRGSFIESFPLFGYDLDDYDELFAEKLELLLALRESNPVTWSGRHRAPLRSAGVWPRPVQDPLPVWVAVGGTPQSVVRAATLGLPLTIAIIGGQPAHFVPLVEPVPPRLGDAAGHAHDPQLAINTHGFVAPTREQADAAFAPSYLTMMNRIGRERGWPPSGRAEYDALTSPLGAVAVGSPGAGRREAALRARAVRAPALHPADEPRHRRARGCAAGDRAVRDRGGADRPRRGGTPPAVRRRRRR